MRNDRRGGSHYEIVALPDTDQDVNKDLQFFLPILFARVHAVISVSKPFFLSNSNERVWEWSVSFLGSKTEEHIGSKLYRQPSWSFVYKNISIYELIFP